MWFVLPPSEVRRSHTANPPLPGLQPPSLVILLPSPPTLKQVVRRTLQRPRPQYGRLRYRCQGGSRSNVMAKLRANFAFVDTTIPRTCIRMRYASVEPGAVDCPGRNCSSHTIRPWGGDDGLDNQRLSRKLPNFDSNTKQMIFGVCLCFLHVHLVLPIVLSHASPLDG